MPDKTGSPWPNFIAKAVSAVVVIVALVGYTHWAHAVNDADDQVRMQMAEDQRAVQQGPFDVADGTYRGKARGYGGDVVVAVTVKNGYIVKLEDVSHAHEDKEWWDLAKALFEAIPEKQSTDVDTVSSATYSSTGIIDATKKALNSAQKRER